MTGLDAVARSQCVGRQSQGVGAGREQRGWNQSSRGLPCFSEWTIRLALSAASLRPQSALRARAGDEDRDEQDIFRMASKVIALSSTDRLGASCWHCGRVGSRVGRPISLAGRTIKDCSLPAAMQQRLGKWLQS